MKTLPTLSLLAALLTAAGWVSLQTVSSATGFEPAGTAAEPPAGPRAAPHPASPPPLLAASAAETERQAKFRRALEDDDLCAVTRQLDELVPTEFYGALLAAIDASANLRETFAPGGPMLGRRSEPAASGHAPSLAAQTAWAFKTAGLGLVVVETTGENAAAGRERLIELAKRDPGNAFYPFFRLILEKRLGYGNDQLRATAEEVAQGTVFESPVAKLWLEIDDAAWRNSALYYAVNDYDWAMPGTPYLGGGGILAKLAGEAGFTGNSRIAALLAEEALQLNHAPGPHFDLSRFEAAHELDPAQVPSFAELAHQRGWRIAPPPPRPFQDDEKNDRCRAAAYETAFQEARDAQ